MDSAVVLVLAGDVMTGRGVDQVLPHPGAPGLHEQFVTDARTYVDLVEAVNGPLPRPVGYAWPWGDALPWMDGLGRSVRLMNLETSLTRSDDAMPGKAVHYRMSPENVACLAAARSDVWALANNHVLDYGRRGFRETLEVLRASGQPVAGAGMDEEEAWAPVAVPVDGQRVLVWSVAHGSSGVPTGWAASRHRPGVALLPDLSDATAALLAGRISEERRSGDVVVVSVHWGSNWGYRVPRAQVRFAHLLVDAGVHVVHGHSSHHPRPVEVYRGRLVLYGCGDLVNDYEGIGGHEDLRGDLRLLYCARVQPDTGRLSSLEMLPLRAVQMRLRTADEPDVRWVADVLTREGRRFGTEVVRTGNGALRLRHRSSG